MTSSENKLVVVAGATGYLGRAVARTLADAGWRVRALARDPAGLGDIADRCHETFVGHATRPETLAGLCDGARAVFSSIGIRHFRRKPTLWDVDWRANENIVRSAESAGVRDFVFVSLLHGDRLRDRIPVAEARERVVDALAATPMRTTVLRPTGFFNDMRELFTMAERGKVWLVGNGHARINPIAAEDIAAATADILRDPAAFPRALELGGPDIFTMREIAELAFSTLGKRPRIGHIPPRLLRAVATVTSPFNTNLAAFCRMFSLLGEEDAVAPSYGDTHLDTFYRSLAT